MQHQNIDHFRSGSNGESNYYYQEQGYNSKEVHKKPYFEIVQNPKTGQGGRNVTTAEGGKAILLCTVRHLEDNYTVRKCLKIPYFAYFDLLHYDPFTIFFCSCSRSHGFAKDVIL